MPLVHELNRLYVAQKSSMDLFPMKITFRESHLVGSTRFLQKNQDFCSRFQPRHLDLRLSTHNFYDDDDDDLDCEEVDLSLSIGMSTNKKRKSFQKSWKNEIVYTSSQDIIVLEDSTETGSNTVLRNVANLHQDHLKIETYCKRESSINGGMHKELSSFNQGSNGSKLIDLDLNKDQLDESGPDPSSDGSCNESFRQITTSLTFKSQTNTKNSQTKIYTIDLESLPEEKHSDYAAQKAALSLISISLQNKVPETKIGSNETQKVNETTKKSTITRSSSIDSYESLVLKLEESNVEEDSGTSKMFEINESVRNDFRPGIKLRRGTRLKDFKKDVLPILSSLSKHEIWEDIKILEGVIRSREYKRLHKAKIGKNKRSKVNYIGQTKRK